MEFTNQLIFIGSFLMLLSVLVGLVSSRTGSPILLTFLGVGIFFGEDGPGGIIFDDTEMAYMVCSLALAVILFDGGLRTSIHRFRIAFKPAFILSTAGVLITAVIIGGFAVWFLDVGLLNGFLIGAIVASTDAAAVFLLLHQGGIKLKQRMNATLEVESGMNDPMAIFLTITCVELMLAETAGSWMSIAGFFVKQMGLGVVIGYAGGMGLAKLMRAMKFDVGLYPVVTMAGGLFIFGGTNMAGGSGFLAAYIAGLTFANSGLSKMMLIQQFNDGMAWVAQLIMMLLLGLLVTPSNLVAYIVPALWIAMAMIFIARPIAVWACLPFSGFSWQEKTFISWVGLRGAVPIYLALIPALSGVPNGHYYFNTAFIIVLVSLVVQGWSINPIARKLGLIEATQPPDKS